MGYSPFSKRRKMVGEKKRSGLRERVIEDSERRRWCDLWVRFRFPFIERLNHFGWLRWVVRVMEVNGWLMR